jgi:hypothetical protein
MTTPNTILAIDLVNMKKKEVKEFKYLLNGIDMGSRYICSVAMKKNTQSKIRAIRPDNGSEFINKKVVDFFRKE